MIKSLFALMLIAGILAAARRSDAGREPLRC